MKLPPITTKQQDIIKLLYRYRFLDRIQIQALMGHKDKRRSSRWLKDLLEKHYIEWIYSTDFTEKSKPAIYYIGLNGVRYLRAIEEYPPEELRKRYKESSRKQDFIARCLLIADCCLNLETKTVGKTHYSFVNASDYTDPDDEYYFLSELHPHLCFVKTAPRSKNSYLLEVFDTTTPRYMVKKRLDNYVQYLTNNDWESETGDKDPPIILIACSSVAELAYAKRRTRTLLQNIWGEDIPEDIILRFATITKLKLEGVTGTIWEDI